MSDLKLFNQTITSQKMQNYLAQVLGEKKSSFVNNITALVSNNKALQECEPVSIMYAGVKATALDLPLDANLGFAYVIPFKNNKEHITEAQFQIGYKGFKQLAIRSGQFSILNSTDVREGEIISRNRLSGEIAFNFIKDEDARLKAKVIGFVSFFELTNGFTSTFYMSVEELKAHGMRYSQTYKSSNKYVADNSKWNTDFEAMAIKTVTKLNLSKNAPLSVEMQGAVISDQAIFGEKGQRYVDNEQYEQDAEASKKVADIFEKAIQQPEEAQVVPNDEPEQAKILSL